MGTFLVLILESAICLALFYLLYKLALSKDTFHRFNRVVLLSMLLLSAVIPVSAILLESASQPQVQLAATSITSVQVVDIVPEVPIETPGKSFPLALALMVSFYAVGVLFFSGRLLRNRIVLYSLMRKCTVEELDGRIKFFTHHLPIAPFSWMRSIVVSSKDLTDNKDIILTHELAHIQLGHSWDLLVTDLCILVQWFNPAAWLIRQELQAVHEFEADDKVLQKGIDAKKYQLLIIEKAVGTRLYSMANSFNHGSLKKRITMMLKEKSSPWARAKYALVLPLVAIALMGFARPEFTNLQAQSAGEIDQLLSWTEVSAPAGPSSNPSPSPSARPNPSPQDKSSGNPVNPSSSKEKKSTDKQPLVVVDGVLVKSSDLSGLKFRTATQDDFAKNLNLSPSDIQEITVLKGEAAVSLYGEKGRDGVILITTKAKKQSEPVVENFHVSGQVLNALGNSPLVGVSIREINADRRILSSTVTGTDGRFSLTVKRSDNELFFSHLSYELVVVPIQKDMTIVLTQKKIMLKETVVTARQKSEATPVSDAPQKETEILIEQMPKYPGGDEALMKYIRDNMRYPPVALNKGIQGKVICSFIIDASGVVTDVKVINSVDPVLDAEAVRVIYGMPNWIPGKQNGKDCAVQYAMPVVFTIEKKL